MQPPKPGKHKALCCASGFDPYSVIRTVLYSTIRTVLKSFHIDVDNVKDDKRSGSVAMPPLDVELAQMFGHDGLGLYSRENGVIIPGSLDTVSLILNPTP